MLFFIYRTMSRNAAVTNPDQARTKNIYRHVGALFRNTHLPSHDETHHARVWENARTLLKAFEAQGHTFNRMFTENLLLAAFFHDTGMIRETGPSHGSFSRLLLTEFLEQSAPDLSIYQPALVAVEKHDDKTYLNEGNELIRILGMADDMDAMGRIGIIRYLEIYLMRGIPPGRIPGKVLTNLEARFTHMKKYFPHDQTLWDTQKVKYELTRTFFRSAGKASGNRHGQTTCLKVFDLVKSRVIGKKESYERLCHHVLENPSDNDILEFFRGFLEEMQAYTQAGNQG